MTPKILLHDPKTCRKSPPPIWQTKGHPMVATLTKSRHGEGVPTRDESRRRWSIKIGYAWKLDGTRGRKTFGWTDRAEAYGESARLQREWITIKRLWSDQWPTIKRHYPQAHPDEPCWID